jgi:ketosteroid isomerase-like protein
MKFFSLSLFLVISLPALCQSKDEIEIKKVLSVQTDSWNKGDIEGFMKTYWHSDSLLFIGKNGVRHGWQAALDNYKKGYPDTIAMGKLSFDIILIKKLSPEYYYVVGKWNLSRTIGDLSGHFDILLRKIKGQWAIIADHSS